jgi:hypothetical protein
MLVHNKLHIREPCMQSRRRSDGQTQVTDRNNLPYHRNPIVTLGTGRRRKPSRSSRKELGRARRTHSSKPATAAGTRPGSPGEAERSLTGERHIGPFVRCAPSPGPRLGKVAVERVADRPSHEGAEIQPTHRQSPGLSPRRHTRRRFACRSSMHKVSRRVLSEFDRIEDPLTTADPSGRWSQSGLNDMIGSASFRVPPLPIATVNAMKR